MKGGLQGRPRPVDAEPANEPAQEPATSVPDGRVSRRKAGERQATQRQSDTQRAATARQAEPSASCDASQAFALSYVSLQNW